MSRCPCRFLAGVQAPSFVAGPAVGPAATVFFSVGGYRQPDTEVTDLAVAQDDRVGGDDVVAVEDPHVAHDLRLVACRGPDWSG